MREIEFRGKTSDVVGDKKIWIYGDLLQGCEICDVFEISDRESIDGTRYQIDPKTVGQYTGLKDKNGIKIYEEDILKYDGGGIFIVTFDEMMIMCPKDKMEMLSPGYYGILLNDKNKELCPLGPTQVICEIIGNIHDNPELLERKN